MRLLLPFSQTFGLSCDFLDGGLLRMVMDYACGRCSAGIDVEISEKLFLPSKITSLWGVMRGVN